MDKLKEYQEEVLPIMQELDFVCEKLQMSYVTAFFVAQEKVEHPEKGEGRRNTVSTTTHIFENEGDDLVTPPEIEAIAWVNQLPAEFASAVIGLAHMYIAGHSEEEMAVEKHDIDSAPANTKLH